MANHFLMQKDFVLARNPELRSIIHELTYLTELNYECKVYVQKLIGFAERIVQYLTSHSMLTIEWQSFFCKLLQSKMHRDTREYQNTSSSKSIAQIIWFLEKRVEILNDFEGGIEYLKHINKK